MVSAADDRPRPPKTRRRRPWLAAILSFFGPGTGQLYNGQFRRAARLFAAYLAIDAFLALVLPHFPVTQGAIAVLLVALAIGIVLQIGSTIDAFRSARKIGTVSLGRFQKVWLYAAMILVVIGINMTTPRFIQAFHTPSQSNLPTLLVGDRLIVDPEFYRTHLPQRGEMAVFKLPSDPSIDYIKRIIGLPGDRVQMRAGKLYLNDQEVPRRPIDDFAVQEGDTAVTFHQFVESLPRREGEASAEYRILKLGESGPLDNTPVYEVPEGRYFTLGDNRDNSLDSRVATFGLVPRSHLIGRVDFVFYSTDGPSRWWKIWEWPGAIRYRRFFQKLDHYEDQKRG